MSIEAMKTVDLEKIRDDYKAAASKIQRRIIICAGTGCVANGSLEVRDALGEDGRQVFGAVRHGAQDLQIVAVSGQDILVQPARKGAAGKKIVVVEDRVCEMRGESVLLAGREQRGVSAGVFFGIVLFDRADECRRRFFEAYAAKQNKFLYRLCFHKYSPSGNCREIIFIILFFSCKSNRLRGFAA